MKRAFTLIELMICLAIVAVIVAVIAAIAIPSIMNANIIGKDCMWQGQRVRVLARDANTDPTLYLIRTSKGEAHVSRDELTPVTDVEKQ